MTGPRDFSSRGRGPASTTVARVVLITGGLALLLSCFAAWDAWMGDRDARLSLDQAHRETEATRARLQVLKARAGPEQTLAAKALLTAEAPPPRVVSDLLRLMPPDVRLEGLGLTYGASLQVDLQVVARGTAAYDLFVDRLEQSPLFTDVLPGDENRGGEVRAAIQATYRGAGL
jgi:hypothetical protein